MSLKSSRQVAAAIMLAAALGLAVPRPAVASTLSTRPAVTVWQQAGLWITGLWQDVTRVFLPGLSPTNDDHGTIDPDG